MKKLTMRNTELAHQVAALADMLALEFQESPVLVVRLGQSDVPIVDANVNLHVRGLIKALRKSSGELTRNMSRLASTAEADV